MDFNLMDYEVYNMEQYYDLIDDWMYDEMERLEIGPFTMSEIEAANDLFDELMWISTDEDNNRIVAFRKDERLFEIPLGPFITVGDVINLPLERLEILTGYLPNGLKVKQVIRKKSLTEKMEEESQVSPDMQAFKVYTCGGYGTDKDATVVFAKSKDEAKQKMQMYLDDYKEEQARWNKSCKYREICGVEPIAVNAYGFIK